MKEFKKLIYMAAAISLLSCSNNEPFYPDGPPEWGGGPDFPGNS